MLCLFLFFKQKTAYEMRISDWSSDVCSSDLRAAATAALKRGLASFGRGNVSGALAAAQEATIADESWGLAHAFAARLHLAQGDGDAAEAEIARALRTGFAARRTHHLLAERSEEYTSELQSLMRTSYAVFCLKKKTKYNTIK